MTDVRELIERYRRWLSHTGFDGGVNSPPVLVLDALSAALEREEALRGLVLAMLDLIRDYTGDGRTNVAGLITWFEEWKESAEAALSENSQ